MASYNLGDFLMPTSVRLDRDTEAILRKLARSSGRTKSEILREALLRFSESHDQSSPDEGPYALVSDLVGIAKGGPDDLARNHKRAYREGLAIRSSR